MNIEGKRLLVLGSKLLLAEIVKKAQSMGVIVGVTDYVPYEDAPGKQIADEYYNVSLADVESVADIVREHEFDGVLTGFTDSYLEYYREICESAHVPCYGTESLLSIATNKRLFKEMCVAAGLSVIPGGASSLWGDAEAIAKQNGYPLILKPADNSGSRGVVRCETEHDLHDAFDYALSFSPSKTVIVEKYMRCESMGISYFIVDGEPTLTSTCDRGMYVSGDSGSSIASSLLYPSKHAKRYIEQVDSVVRSMLQSNGFKNGMLSLQAFADDEDFYFCEMCFRPSGGHHYIFIEDQTGLDELGMLIEFSVTGRIESFDASSVNPCFQEPCAVGKILGIPGKLIDKIDGIDALSDSEEVLFVSPSIREGETIGVDGTTAQVIASVWYKCNQLEDRNNVFERITLPLTVTDVEGNSLIQERIG